MIIKNKLFLPLVPFLLLATFPMNKVKDIDGSSKIEFAFSENVSSTDINVAVEENPTKKTPKSMKSTDIQDNVHGFINIPPRILPILNSRPVQRLRDLKQLGTSSFIYPGANHSRFEHSIGVMHLATTLLSHLDINESERFCVQTAGLLHDIGHGPFSHLFEQFLNTDWTHEKKTLQLVDHLFNEISEQNIATDEEISLVKAIISPVSNPELVQIKDKENKSFLFEIIANEESGFDVDKADYILRDARASGAQVSFGISSASYIFKDVQIIKGHLYYSKKSRREVSRLFTSRKELHEMVYQHKTSTAIDLMILDAWRNSTELRRIAESKNLDEYLELDDSALKLYGDPKIVKKIYWHDLYKNIGDERVEFNVGDDDLEDELYSRLRGFSEDVVIKTIKLHRGKKNEDPLKYVRFYDADGPITLSHAHKENLEFRIRAYVKNAKLQQQGKQIYKDWIADLKKRENKK